MATVTANRPSTTGAQPKQGLQVAQKQQSVPGKPIWNTPQCVDPNTPWLSEYLRRQSAAVRPTSSASTQPGTGTGQGIASAGAVCTRNEQSECIPSDWAFALFEPVSSLSVGAGVSPGAQLQPPVGGQPGQASSAAGQRLPSTGTTSATASEASFSNGVPTLPERPINMAVIREWDTAESALEPLEALASSQVAPGHAGDRCIGAVKGSAFLGCLAISGLTVVPDRRHEGHGSQLLMTALNHGRSLGCGMATIEIMDYQDPGFLEKVGFRKEFERPGYAGSHRMCYYSMKLGGGAGGGSVGMTRDTMLTSGAGYPIGGSGGASQPVSQSGLGGPIQASLQSSDLPQSQISR